MSKCHTFSAFNCLGRILGFVWITLAANSFAGAQSKLVDDLPTDARVRIVDQRMHHEVYGTGFVAEIDLSGLPAWTGDLELSAVEWPVSKETVRERFSDIGDRGSRNPFVAFTVALARIGSMAGNSRRDIEPLIPETVFALSEGVVDSGNGKMVIPTLPENKRIRFFIPHAMVQDSDRVYFMLKADQFKVPVKYFYTEQLFPDTLLPDLKVAFVRSEATRYQGAAGKMITLSYQFPEYLLKFTREYHGMTPELTLNGKYPIPKPGSSPISWNFVKKSTGKLYFFIPDALYDEAGKAYVDISFKEEERSPRIGYQRVQLEGEPSFRNIIGLRVFSVEETTDKEGTKVCSAYEFRFVLGGITIGSSGRCSKEKTYFNTIGWDDYPIVNAPFSRNDSISCEFGIEQAFEEGRPYFSVWLGQESIDKKKINTTYKRAYFNANWKFTLHQRKENNVGSDGKSRTSKPIIVRVKSSKPVN